MGVRYQLVIDCADPDKLSRFWAEALGYVAEPPPAGFAAWDDYYRHLGLDESYLGRGQDCIIDPAGGGPRIWFNATPEAKSVKNRLHLDIAASGGRSLPLETRKKNVHAEAERLVALGATMTCVLASEGVDHYAVGMRDPEDNEFDIN